MIAKLIFTRKTKMEKLHLIYAAMIWNRKSLNFTNPPNQRRHFNFNLIPSKIPKNINTGKRTIQKFPTFSWGIKTTWTFKESMKITVDKVIILQALKKTYTKEKWGRSLEEKISSKKIINFSESTYKAITFRTSKLQALPIQMW